jgi:hypothetical protein
MVNVLRESIAHCGANFVVALALKIVRGCKTAEIGHRFEIPDDETLASIVVFKRQFVYKSTANKI